MTTAPALLPLVARTVPIPDPGRLLELLPARAALAWVRRGEGLVGWGEAARVSTAGPDRFADAQRAWSQMMAHSVVRDEVRLPGTGPVAFGSFAFSPKSEAGGVLVVPEVLIGHKAGTWWLTTVGVGGVLPPIQRIAAAPPATADPGPVTFSDGVLSAPEWTCVVADAIARIGVGTVEKVVLARDLLARSSEPIDPRRLLTRLAERYPGCWTF